MSQQIRPPINSPEAIERGLAGKTVAIVVLSSRPDSASFPVASYLQSHGYRVIPVNPTEKSVLGEVSYPSLRDIPEKVDVVDVFRRSDLTPAIAAEAIEIGAGVLWMQLGIANHRAEQLTREAKLPVIIKRWLKIESTARHPHP